MESLAQFVAAYATLILAGTVVGGLLATILVWSWRSRFGPALRTLNTTPAAPFILPLAGFLLIALALGGFGELAEGIGPGADLNRFDRALDRALRSNAPATQWFFDYVTHLGSGITLSVLAFVVGAVLLAKRRLVLVYAWMIALGGTGLLNAALKMWFARARPGEVPLLATWSFPSGHAMNSLVAYGMLAYVLLHTTPRRYAPAIIGAAVTVALLVGASRVLLHYHYFSDVLAGYAAGLAWLTVCVTAAELAQRRLSGQPAPRDL